MSSRTTRRSRPNRLALIKCAALDRRAREAARILIGWRAEARRRARSLGAPAVWELARHPEIHAVIDRLDPAGGLRADLDRVCAEAVAGVAGRHLVCGSRPLADRSRREQT